MFMRTLLSLKLKEKMTMMIPMIKTNHDSENIAITAQLDFLQNLLLPRNSNVPAASSKLGIPPPTSTG